MHRGQVRLRHLCRGLLLGLVLAAPAHAADSVYPASGLFPKGAHVTREHPDQGQDLAVQPYNTIIQAPGNGCVIAIGQDQPWAGGFGPNYPIVEITSGAFAGHDWYLGHTSALVSAGQCFKFGAPLARLDQGRACWIHYASCGASNDGSWIEFGLYFNGRDGGGIVRDTDWWFAPLLFQNLTLKDPYGFYPTTVFFLANGEHGSEYSTVRTWDQFGCENPVRRPTCKSTRYHLKLERDRDVWVAQHKLVVQHGKTVWVVAHPARYGASDLGRRVAGFQKRITAPHGQKLPLLAVVTP